MVSFVAEVMLLSSLVLLPHPPSSVAAASAIAAVNKTILFFM